MPPPVIIYTRGNTQNEWFRCELMRNCYESTSVEPPRNEDWGLVSAEEPLVSLWSSMPPVRAERALGGSLDVYWLTKFGVGPLYNTKMCFGLYIWMDILAEVHCPTDLGCIYVMHAYGFMPNHTNTEWGWV